MWLGPSLPSFSARPSVLLSRIHLQICCIIHDKLFEESSTCDMGDAFAVGRGLRGGSEPKNGSNEQPDLAYRNYVLRTQNLCILINLTFRGSYSQYASKMDALSLSLLILLLCNLSLCVCITSGTNVLHVKSGLPLSPRHAFSDKKPLPSLFDLSRKD